MKKKDQTVEVFSFSALDLFASALGKFVMLSVIMLPYDYKGKELEAKRQPLTSITTLGKPGRGSGTEAQRKGGRA